MLLLEEKKLGKRRLWITVEVFKFRGIGVLIFSNAVDICFPFFNVTIEK